MRTCKNCGGELGPNPKQVWCSRACTSTWRSRQRPRKGYSGSFDAGIARARSRYPSLDREWTADMVSDTMVEQLAGWYTKYDRRNS